mmetsp:Transcript_77043/g.217927  ORF Transcript_77043/g.217927 Transcript_77043/m.217927 type:complete len:357 (+) Transcript_77043:194-1264(+)
MEATLSVSKQTGVGRFRIEGFSLLHRKKGDAVSSGPIIDVGDAQWEILVYPRGNDRCKDGWIRVSVRCTRGQRETRALYSVSVVNQAGEVRHKLEEEAIFTSGDGWGFDNFISLERLSDTTKGFVDDIVVFEASVTVLGQEVVSVMPLEAGGASAGQAAEDLAADFRALWASGQRSDVVLQAGGAELRVHALVLTARSPVFARMLAADMAEASTGVIRIEDVEPETMLQLCEYVYTGSIRDGRPWEDAEAAGALLQAASKYEVHGLVRLCAAKAAMMLTIDSVAEWLILASQIGPQAEALRVRCLQFAAAHLSEVQATEGWQRLMQNQRVVSEVAPMLFQAISPPAKKRRVARRLE